MYWPTANFTTEDLRSLLRLFPGAAEDEALVAAASRRLGCPPKFLNFLLRTYTHATGKRLPSEAQLQVLSLYFEMHDEETGDPPSVGDLARECLVRSAYYSRQDPKPQEDNVRRQVDRTLKLLDQQPDPDAASAQATCLNEQQAIELRTKAVAEKPPRVSGKKREASPQSQGSPDEQEEEHEEERESVRLSTQPSVVLSQEHDDSDAALPSQLVAGRTMRREGLATQRLAEMRAFHKTHGRRRDPEGVFREWDVNVDLRPVGSQASRFTF